MADIHSVENLSFPHSVENYVEKVKSGFIKV